MAETKVVTHPREDHEIVVERAKDFWTRNNRAIMTLGLAIIVLAIGYIAYKKLVKEPNEGKAADAMFTAENYFRMDSLNLALNGDGRSLGFLKVIDKYGSTKAGNLAHFYAGNIYLQQGNAAKAVSHLKDFETDAAQVQARAYKLLGDAYAEQNKPGDALSAYKKAAHHFEQDETNSSEYLFVAAYYAQRVANNPKEATELFRELKTKFPRSNRGAEADKFLAQLGVYSTEKK